MAGTTSAGASTATSGGDGGVKEQAQDKAQEVREQAAEQMRNAGGQARDRMRDQVDQRSTQAGEKVNTQAGDLRSVAGQLRDQGKEGPAKMVDQVADRAERAGSWLTESDADRILGDVEDFARSNPWAVAAAGLALGFAASRMLKASSSSRYEQRSTAGQLPRAGGTTAGAPVTRPTDPLATPAPVSTPADPLSTPAPVSTPADPASLGTEERFRPPGGPQ
jgi:hypothetical protein